MIQFWQTLGEQTQTWQIVRACSEENSKPDSPLQIIGIVATVLFGMFLIISAIRAWLCPMRDEFGKEGKLHIM